MVLLLKVLQAHVTQTSPFPMPLSRVKAWGISRVSHRSAARNRPEWQVTQGVEITSVHTRGAKKKMCHL